MASEGVERSGFSPIRLLPWCVAIGLLYYIFTTTDLDGFVQGVQSAHILAFAAASLLIYPLVFLVDTLSIWRLFNWFACPVRYREIRPLVGANYLLTIVNYSAGGAGMSAYLWRTHGVKLFQTFGSVLWMNTIDLVIVAAIVFVGADVLGDLAMSARLLSGCVLVAFAGAMVYWRLGFDFFILGPLRSRSIFYAFSQARLRHYLVMFGMRAMLAGTYFLLDWLTLLAFGINIPLIELLVYVPIQMLVAALPITIAGIGTVQVAQRVLYGRYAAQALIDAYAVSLVVAYLAPRVLIGVFYLRGASNALAGGTEEPVVQATPSQSRTN